MRVSHMMKITPYEGHGSLSRRDRQLVFDKSWPSDIDLPGFHDSSSPVDRDPMLPVLKVVEEEQHPNWPVLECFLATLVG
jgi:hypothetical protein